MINNKFFFDDLEEEIFKNKGKQIIFLCIGTDKINGDILGPLVGTTLKNKKKKNENFKIEVIGELNNLVYYSKVEKVIEKIQKKYKNPFIIAIDSALSSEKNIGKFFLEKRGLKYGEGLNKDAKLVGDIGIKGVVAKNMDNEFENFKALKEVSLKEIIKLSKKLSNSIYELMNKIA